MIEVLLVKRAANGYVIHVPKGVVKLEAIGHPTIAGNAKMLGEELEKIFDFEFETERIIPREAAPWE